MNCLFLGVDATLSRTSYLSCLQNFVPRWLIQHTTIRMVIHDVLASSLSCCFYFRQAWQFTKRRSNVSWTLVLAWMFFPIMGLWTSKMFYTSRFYVVDDIFHRLFEVATLIPLAMSILHIRTVPILSDPQHYVDIFAFTLSITIGILLNLTRSVEVMICQHFWNTDGLFPEAYYAGQRDLIFGVPSLAFALAATIYSGQQYYGYKTDSGSDATGSYKDDDGNHRIMADAKAGGTTNDEDDIAIWLSLAGPISNLVLMFSYILLAFRGSVDFKK